MPERNFNLPLEILLSRKLRGWLSAADAKTTPTPKLRPVTRETGETDCQLSHETNKGCIHCY
jgi:hypothetical protein